MEFTIPETMTPEDVTTLIKRVKVLTNGDIKRKINITLETDDEKTASILGTLLQTEGDDGSVRRPYTRKKKADADDLSHTNDASKTWELLDENDQVLDTMTIEDKNMRLAGGKFPTGARLRYRRTGIVSSVTGQYGKPQGMKL